MLRFETLLAIAMLAGCGEASHSDSVVEKRANDARPLPMPGDLALVTILDGAAHAMSEQVRAEGGNAEIENYSVVRNSKCSEMTSDSALARRIKCEFDSTTEFSPIVGDDDHIRKVMRDNSREWTRVSSTFEQDGENWKVQTPPTKL
jgi:hypothetical protein